MSQWKLGALMVFPASAALWMGCCSPGERTSSTEENAPAPPIEVASLAPPPAPGGGRQPAGPVYDVQMRLLERIPPGTVLPDKELPKGWTNLVLFVNPRLGSGDVQAAPKMAANFASMFHLTVLANVASQRNGDQVSYYLEKLAVGYALQAKDKLVIATPQKPQGVNLGFIGQSVFEENEKGLTEVPQVARSRTMAVFEANKALVLREGKHQRMVVRHAVVVNPANGKLFTLVWLLGPGKDGELVAAEDAMQLLPPGLKEDRIINVKKEKFNVLGIPAQDAFAMVKISQGTPIKFTPELQKAASVRTFTAESAAKLEAELRKTLQSVKAP